MPDVPLPLAERLPKTNRSKSFSPTSSLPPERPLTEPTFMRSFDLVWSTDPVEVEEISLSFLICSCSIRADRLLMRFMKAWNCWRLSSGPRLKLHKIGNASMARNSASAILPTCLKTARAAIITAGSFVFIALSKGTTFSWTVYLSSTALLFDLDFLVSLIAPFRSSPRSELSSLEPPQRITNAYIESRVSRILLALERICFAVAASRPTSTCT